MTLEERIAFENVIGLATLPSAERKERKVYVTYWNDETLTYTAGTFYISDSTFTIHNIKEAERDIEYNPFTLTLTEY